VFRIHPITSLDLPPLGPYRTMRRQMEHRQQGIFVAEGEKVVRRLLESRFGVVSLLIPAKWVAPLEPLLQTRPEMIEVYVAEKALLETMIGFSMYQGLLAVGRIPPSASLDDILARSARPRLLAAVDSLSSAENLGALVRNCTAFGVHALITSETSSSPFLRRAVRSSMGTVFQLPVIELAHGCSGQRELRPEGAVSREADRAEDKSPPPPVQGPRGEAHVGGYKTLADTLSYLRKRDIYCVAAHPHGTSKIPAKIDFKRDCCIVFGSEGYGISEQVLNVCDEAAAIPMATSVDSLNVAAAAAAFLYEIQRQRAV
jgi:tRNA G18 (ribose-2'-O)-methylase SpoU